MKLHERFSSVGSPIIRSDGHPKVTGATHYTADHNLPGMIWGKCLRSPLPHAQIRRIDVQKAKKIKGVFAVVTATDIPARLTGIILKDMPILAQDRVRFVGERVAVVGAQSPDVAEEAINRNRGRPERGRQGLHPDDRPRYRNRRTHDLPPDPSRGA
jgi:CO/xanthine dehydrogenase Mo-binding subunit